jgi:hypothetical protein
MKIHREIESCGGGLTLIRRVIKRLEANTKDSRYWVHIPRIQALEFANYLMGCWKGLNHTKHPTTTTDLPDLAKFISHSHPKTSDPTAQAPNVV